MSDRSILIIIAVIFAWIETAYYGYNFWPSSDAELICDGIALILFALAIVVPADRGKTNEQS